MRKNIFFIDSIIIFLMSCSEVDMDCLCTDEYRSYLVNVVDISGNPVDSLSISIIDNDGNELDVQQEPFYLNSGMYTVFNDAFTQTLCSCGSPIEIYFNATDGTRTATGEFLFNTDKCKCHINKVAGPDTLVLR